MADGTKITTKRARPKLNHSPAAKWARKQQASGNCRACGGDRRTEAEINAGVEKGQSKLKQLCRGCQDTVNTYMKAYRFRRAHHINAATLISPESKENLNDKQDEAVTADGD